MSARSRSPRSLQAKALQLLAQREQSRVELRRKLSAHARAMDKAEADENARFTAGDREPAADRAADAVADERPSIETRVEAVLAWLESRRFSSDERFAESRVHARQDRFGNLRIRQELATHAIALTDEAAQKLRDSELDRALDVSDRKFATMPIDRADAARQSRFLIARGFSPEVVRRVLQIRTRRAAANTDSGPRADPDGA